MRELEDGLRASHGQHSGETHPLLSEDLLRIKAPLQRENLSSTTNGNSDEPGGDVVDSFGSLSISDTGRTNYFGQATSSFVRPSCYAPRISTHLVPQYFLQVRMRIYPARALILNHR